MRRERNTHTTTSKYGVPYKQSRKPVKSPAERRHEENSLVIKNIYTSGGNDIA